MADPIRVNPESGGGSLASDYRHILITRYNLSTRSGQMAGFDPLDPAWLAHREALFLRFCAPSIARQTVRDVWWVMLVHPATPERFLATIRQFGEPILARSLTEALKSLSARIPDDGRPLVTTRFDNDDAVAPDFLERSRSAVFAHRQGMKSAVTLAHGLRVRLDTMQARRKLLRRGPFVTMIETAPPWHMAIQGNHANLHEIMPFEAIQSDEPMWVQTIHGRNVMNSFEYGDGEMVDLRLFADRFPGFDGPWDEATPAAGQ